MYATKLSNSRCTACHYSPVGGGPRNKNGKLYNSRLFDSGKWVIQENLSMDFRMLSHWPEKASDSKGGMGIMSGSVAGHFFLNEKQNLLLVVEKNIFGFSVVQLRDAYLRYSLGDGSDDQWIDTIVVGRFRLPFGVVSDEHRAYTRIQSDTRWYKYFIGSMLSGDMKGDFHYDLGIFNGDSHSGQSLKSGGANNWGGIINVRYTPSFWTLGSSHRENQSIKSSTTKASSVYFSLSIDRWSEAGVPVDLVAEYVRAQGFNSILGGGLASSGSYVDSIAEEESEGVMLEAQYHFSQRLSAIYKYDQLIADVNYPADFYIRHGIGINWSFAALTRLILRQEWADASHPSEDSKDGMLAQNAFYAVLEVKF